MSELNERPVDLDRLRETHALATAFLNGFRGRENSEISALLRPREEDWEVAFLPEYAERAQQAYAGFWATDPFPESHRYQIDAVISGVIPAWMFGSDNPASRQHPGGYRGITPALQPDTHWVSWKFVEPGRSTGFAHNGLVRVADDRWAWFPKPWRALAVPRAPTEPPV